MKFFLILFSIMVLSSTALSRDIKFSSCKEAKEAGYSDIKRGEPGYSSKLDRDNDGIACESN